MNGNNYDCMQTLAEEIQDGGAKFDHVVETSSRHCAGANPEVEKIREQYTRLEKAWRAITDRVKALQERVVPWKELTELYDKLCNSHERLSTMVERTETIVEERDGGNLSDIIHQLKVHERGKQCTIKSHTYRASDSTYNSTLIL